MQPLSIDRESIPDEVQRRTEIPQRKEGLLGNLLVYRIASETGQSADCRRISFASRRTKGEISTDIPARAKRLPHCRSRSTLVL